MIKTILPRIDELGATDTSEAFVGRLESAHGTLPMCQLGYRVAIRSLAVQTEITQTFYNPYNVPMEARYVFPLSGTAAVVDCQMIIGDRVIHADLEERGQARKRYRQAIRRGQQAALLEENRSETFALTVGNIPAGHFVQVKLVTVAQLPVVNSQWTLRLPMVIPPRYTSGAALPQMPTQFTGRRSANSNIGVVSPTDEVPDAEQVSPPVLLKGCRNPVELSVEVDIELQKLTPPSAWIDHLESSLHAVIVESVDNEHCRLKIQPGERVNRDFILRGKVAQDQVCVSGRLQQPTKSRPGTFAIDLIPPQLSSEQEARPRTVIFLMDHSGSMSGWKMPAAQRGVCRLIDSLNNRDRFSVIAFDTQLSVFNSLQSNAKSANLFSADDQMRFKAAKWVSQIGARGGTDIAKALDAALDLIEDNPAESRASIVLVTDGQITGEDHVLSRLNTIDVVSRPRIYTLGIDRAVNASVLRRLSDATGGTFELVESERQLDQAIAVSASEIGTPVISAITVRQEGSKRDQQDEDLNLQIAARSTDLYAQRSVSIFGRTGHETINLEVTGVDSAGAPWQKKISLSASAPCSHFSDRGDLISLWGRQRVRMLEDQYTIDQSHDEVTNEARRQQIIDTSLESRVLSRFTAYVAVDDIQFARSSGKLHQVEQPNEIPEGWNFPNFQPIPGEHLLDLPVDESYTSDNETPQTGLFNLSPENEAKVSEWLLKKGHVTQEQLEDAQRVADSKANQNRLEVAHSMGYTTVSQLLPAVAAVANVPFIETIDFTDTAVIELMPESIARENMVLPVGMDGETLVIATANPWDVETRDNLRFILNRNVSLVVADRQTIINGINFGYGQIEGESADSMLMEFHETGDAYFGYVDQGESADSMLQEFTDTMIDFTETVDDEDEEDFAPAVVRLVDTMFAEMVQLKASKIELKKFEDQVEVRYLIDGESRVRDQLPLRQWMAIVQEIKLRVQATLGEIDLQLDTPYRFVEVAGTVSLTLEVTFADERVVMTIMKKREREPIS